MKTYSSKALVELFHLLFLDLLGRKADRKNYALKGGCNLRFFLKSMRYSEDMDIDVGPGLPKDRLEDLVGRILVSKSFKDLLALRRIRIEEHSAPKQTNTTQRWKFGLAVDQSPMLLRTKIEFSRRGMGGEIAFDPVDPLLVQAYELTPLLASHYTPGSAFEQKVNALAHRREVQARDVFDLDLLLNSGARSGSVSNVLCDQAKENALSVTFGMFKAQVLSFLAPEYQNQYDSSEVWDSLVLRVVDALEKRS
jgi:predicted nucleotidyltransferase component of viral defense system